MKPSTADQYGVFFGFFLCHQLTDNLLELWESQGGREKHRTSKTTCREPRMFPVEVTSLYVPSLGTLLL